MKFHDVTLRDGQQAPGVGFAIEEKVSIARMLAEIGVDSIQAGYAGRDDEAIHAIKAVVGGAPVTALLVAYRDDWEVAARSAVAAGADVIEVLIRSADQHLAAMHTDRARTLERTRRVVQFAADLGARVWFVPSFGTLADRGFLEELYAAAATAGATHFTVADSTGVGHPESLAELVKLAKRATDGSVGIHCHDDFGIAVANSIAALSAGVDTIEASVNGYGERAGNCSFEEVAVALELLYKVDTGIDLRRLTELSQVVSAAAGEPPAPNKAVTGAEAFSQQLDVHVQLTATQPQLLEPFDPEVVGNSRHLRLGVGSGPVAVQTRVRELSLPAVSAAAALEIAGQVNELALDRKRYLTDAEFEALVRRGGGL